MRESSQKVLRLVCLGLAAFIVVQLGRMVVNRNPVAHLQIPAVPTLATADATTSPESTNTPLAEGPVKGSTNATAPSSPKATNTVAGVPATNLTNPPAESTGQKGQTNAPGAGEVAKTPTHPVPAVEVGRPGSNALAKATPGKPGGTNSQVQAEKSALNKVPGPRAGIAGNRMPPRMAPGMPPGMPARLPDLAPDILARLDRITDSEILGPVMRPLPMALLGIAGNIAFLRASNGQTGLVKEGDSLGDLKLLRIGINRVLVEDSGEKKELMIYSGMGGESLLPK